MEMVLRMGFYCILLWHVDVYFLSDRLATLFGKNSYLVAHYVRYLRRDGRPFADIWLFHVEPFALCFNRYVLQSGTLLRVPGDGLSDSALRIFTAWRKQKPEYFNECSPLCCFIRFLAVLVCITFRYEPLGRGAAAGGILVVTFAHFNGKRRLLHYFRTNRKRAFIITSIVLCSVIVAGSGAFYLKKDSANGRLFMWKITCRAITEKPWLGYWESFPKIYGEAQEKYFAAGDYTEEEARIAGSPEYAFNEYLQITAEWGLLCLALFLSILILCLYGGIKGKKYGICGALCAFSIFAMSSYPLQFPAFWCALLLMLMACFPNHETHRPSFTCIIGAYLCFNGALLFYQFHEQWSERSVAVEKWNNARLLYNTKAYEAAQTAYEELYKEMHWNFRYLFEYGHTLSKQKQYSEAIFILQKAENESNDPMILNIMGKDFQDMKLYDKAEEFFKRSINRLPSRIYPYYLLAKLYLEPDYYHPEKFKRTAETVLNKQPKVPSPAVEEMKKEIKKLLESEKDTGT